MRPIRIGVVMTTLIVVLGACSRSAAGRSEGWETSLRHALSESAKDRKPVLVAYVNEWDPWCRRMERETFRDAGVRKALEGYRLVRVIPEKDPDAANQHDVYLVPSILILDHRGEETYHVVGFRTAPQLLRELERAREEPGGGAGPGGARTTGGGAGAGSP